MTVWKYTCVCVCVPAPSFSWYGNGSYTWPLSAREEYCAYHRVSFYHQHSHPPQGEGGTTPWIRWVQDLKIFLISVSTPHSDPSPTHQSGAKTWRAWKLHSVEIRPSTANYESNTSFAAAFRAQFFCQKCSSSAGRNFGIIAKTTRPTEEPCLFSILFQVTALWCFPPHLPWKAHSPSTACLLHHWSLAVPVPSAPWEAPGWKSIPMPWSCHWRGCKISDAQFCAIAQKMVAEQSFQKEQNPGDFLCV